MQNDSFSCVGTVSYFTGSLDTYPYVSQYDCSYNATSTLQTFAGDVLLGFGFLLFFASVPFWLFIFGKTAGSNSEKK